MSNVPERMRRVMMCAGPWSHLGRTARLIADQHRLLSKIRQEGKR